MIYLGEIINANGCFLSVQRDNGQDRVCRVDGDLVK